VVDLGDSAAVSVLGATALGVVALHRGETINAGWLILAALLHVHGGVPLLLILRTIPLAGAHRTRLGLP
jgi:hypothetical protein